jgi:DNA polymerase-3 subunit beta
LEADENRGLTVLATDEEMSFIGTTEAQIEQEGRIVVSARDFYDVVRNLPDQQPVDCKWQPEENQFAIRSGAIDFSLQTLPAEEYPDFPKINPEMNYVYSAADLLALIEKTLFAVSQEEARYYLGGVYFECQNGEALRAVATDGHRLALAEGPAPQGFTLSPGQILPRKLLGELRKIIESKQGDISFGFHDRRVVFQYGNQTLLSMLVEGSFPDYRQVVPRSIQVACRVERVELLEALKRISIISPDKSGGVRFTLEDRRLTLSSQHSGRGKGKQEVRVREGGGNLEVGFNARYFIDALQVIDTADVLLEMTNHLSPCIVRPHCEKNDESNRANFSQINVVMPMRL